MKLLCEVFKSVKKIKKKKKQKKTNLIKQKQKPANWSLTLTWLLGFKPTRDRVLLLTNQMYHS
jgi:hypothetical protein